MYTPEAIYAEETSLMEEYAMANARADVTHPENANLGGEGGLSQPTV